MIKADMHIHTRASDGLFSPEEVVAFAKSAGLGALAVTDHDTAFNTEKVNTLCKNSSIKGINGIEVSAYIGNTKVHTLGYGFNLHNVGFIKFLNSLRESSIERTEDILAKLNRCGIYISFEDINAERLSDKTPVHVMHIARAAYKKGYAKSHFGFYGRYLVPGAPACSNICRPSPEDAVKAITAAGGLAVIAHPGRIDIERSELYNLIKRLVAVGLGGIEAVYSTHTAVETAYFKELAEEFGLLVTGGSDTHYSGGSRAIGDPVFQPSKELRHRLQI